MANTQVTDESQDQKYFTITPRLVWAFSRNPFDYTLWSTIKGIAGDAGECFLTTDDLAILSMMSTGQVSLSRKHWMKLGFLFGDFRRDPGYPQPVWHMRVPLETEYRMGRKIHRLEGPRRVQTAAKGRFSHGTRDQKEPSPHEAFTR
jgi:hypothetical protein